MTYSPKMELTKEQSAIMAGRKGEARAYMMESLVRYGDLMGAKRLVPLDYPDIQAAFYPGPDNEKRLLSKLDLIVNSGIVSNGKAAGGLPLHEPVYRESFYAHQLVLASIHEDVLLNERLKKISSFTKEESGCHPHFPEFPKEGETVAFSSPAVVGFANSVFSAKSNLYSPLLSIFAGILGVVPEFGFALKENRQAKIRLALRLRVLPEPSLLAHLIASKAKKAVPYIQGLSSLLKPVPDEMTMSYLKDLTAGLSAYGIYLVHIEGVTPEAIEYRQSLLSPDWKDASLNEDELQSVYTDLAAPDGHYKEAILGCPELTLTQLETYTALAFSLLKKAKREKPRVAVYFNASPTTIEAFKKGPSYELFRKTGIKLTSFCPLRHVLLTGKKTRKTLTNSLPLIQCGASYLTASDLLAFACGGKR